MDDSNDLLEKANEYAASNRISLEENLLGFGQDGSVYRSSRDTAVKSFYRERNYFTERDCYFRLMDLDWISVGDFTIPRFVNHDDELMIVEMNIVSPPYLIDFGKAHLDRRPDFSDEVMDDYYREREELFEPDQWPIVLEAVSDLESIGIYYLDLRPSNVRFRES
ncbi:hypothetical protein LF1_30530 [Rubripirellula obstinata]|uniref:Protein kinase domain-containing protein n=1 Tax=Rubripirellula obstinata TaxID=406547 RepID=A0A5B1CMD4_9BACT|nr:hypothetical protein [Rubripirellula obstinata]KAA1260513.1 hypothetical protein LF1_30530 [Rubripirellula obstinata]